MIRNCTRLECVVNEKSAHFYCDADTPLDVVKEMIFQFQRYVGNIEDQIKAAQEAEKQKEETKEEVVEHFSGGCC